MQPDSTPTLKIKRLHPDAILPRYATAGAACFDLHAIDEGRCTEPSTTYRTGLAVEVPAGYVLLVFSRSGHGFKDDIRLSNCVGVIDSDYRGELQVKLRADGKIGCAFLAGDRIAQAMLVAAPRVEIVETDTLSETERGEGGFGSTGR